MSTEQPEEKKPLPEVPLKWKDFLVSLEKLKHKPYGKKTRERYLIINDHDLLLGDINNWPSYLSYHR